MLNTLSSLGVKLVQGVYLSRTSINKILRKHKLNGYKKNTTLGNFLELKSQTYYGN